ncbi:MAG: NAD-dependent epimerase/dehydratase family protein [Chloroflexota bacterium]|jgi:UDP-glucose 4-epimerase
MSLKEDFFNYYKERAVLITGGLGFLGSNLAHRLVELGADVLLVDSLVPEYGGNLFNIAGIRDKLRVNVADIRDENSINYLVRRQDVIFNLAGQVSHIDSMRDPFTDLEINCRAQLSILEACRKYNPSAKVVFASTRQIYGKPLYLPVDEMHPKRPTDVNGINKMAGEWYHILYNNVHGIRATSLRLTNSYGPRQLMKHNRQGFIPWFVRQVLDGDEISIYGDGSQLRDFAYVDDVVDAFLMAGASPAADGEFFNVGGAGPISLKQFVETLIDVAGSGSYRLVPFPPEKRSIDIGSCYTDYSKIRDALGWEPRVSISEGLRRMVEYYRQHKEHYW